MKSLTVKQQVAVLRAILRNYRRVILRPAGCRVLFHVRQYFTDDFMREIVLQMVVNFGDWERTRADLSERKSERFAKFCRWAERVKGGAL